MQAYRSRASRRCRAAVEGNVENDFPQGQPDRHALVPERVGRPEDPKAGNRHVGADRVGDEVHRTSELAQRPEHLAQGDRGAPVLIERLWSDHQNARDWAVHHAHPPVPAVPKGGVQVGRAVFDDGDG